MKLAIYARRPNSFNSKQRNGVIYVIQFNEAELMRWRMAHDGQEFPREKIYYPRRNRIPNRKCKLIARYWMVRQWHNMRELEHAIEAAKNFINALKAGVKHIPDWEREERYL